MTLRIWFTAQDLARTRVAAPDPFAEALYSLIPLRRFSSHTATMQWRRRTLAGLSAPLRPLLGLLPIPGLLLDLVTVAGPAEGIDESVDNLLGAPRRRLAAEVGYFARDGGGVTGPLGSLLHDDRRSRFELARRLRGYHELAIAPYWPRLRAHLDGERARIGRAIATGGLDGLLAGLGSDQLRWDPPVLELTRPVQPAPETGPDHHLGGRGLLLVPSVFFSGHAPVLARNRSGGRPDMLIYPAPPDPATAGDFWSAPVSQGLSGLLGATRAKVLAAAAGGGSTTMLARRAGIPLPSASQHAAVLRDSGLLTTERRGPSVHHCLTDLGVRLLNRQL